jgi:hypothetical protein
MVGLICTYDGYCDFQLPKGYTFPTIKTTDAVKILKHIFNPSEQDLEIARLDNKVNEQEEQIADLQSQVDKFKEEGRNE